MIPGKKKGRLIIDSSVESKINAFLIIALLLVAGVVLYAAYFFLFTPVGHFRQ